MHTGAERVFSGNLVVLAELELTEVDAAAHGGTAVVVLVLVILLVVGGEAFVLLDGLAGGELGGVRQVPVLLLRKRAWEAIGESAA